MTFSSYSNRFVVIATITTLAIVGGSRYLYQRYWRDTLSELDTRDDATSTGETEAEMMQEQVREEHNDRNRTEVLTIVQLCELFFMFFGIMLMTIVIMLAIFLAYVREDVGGMTEFPMFIPLMSLGLGISIVAFITSEELSIDIIRRVFAQLAPIRREQEADGTVPIIATGKGGIPTAPITSTSRGVNDVRPVNHQQRSIDRAQSRTTDQERPPTAAAAGSPEPLPAAVNTMLTHLDTCAIDRMDDVILVSDKLYEDSRHHDLLQFLRRVNRTSAGQKPILWRLARACNDIASTLEDKDQKKQMATDGYEYAQACIQAYPNSAAANKWMAIMTSSKVEFLPLKEKIKESYVIRDHIQRAIELDPQDATSRSIYGQWCLAFADMSWVERRAAAAIFGTPPSATYEQALDCFLAAENVNPGFWKKNSYLIAQTYFKMGQLAEARVWVDKALEMTTLTEEDRTVHQDCDTLRRRL